MNKEIKQMKIDLDVVLGKFQIRIKKDSEVISSQIVRFKLEELGTPTASKYNRLDRDLPMLLERKVRVITGSEGIFIEVQKKDFDEIKFSTNTEDTKWNKITPILPIGTLINGKKVEIDLASAPHILIGGQSGSGKSVLLKNIIKSLQKQNVDIRIMDPKQVDFAEFEGKKNITDIITNHSDIPWELDYIVSIMEARYAVLKEGGYKNISEAIKSKKKYYSMKRIAVVVDELSDIMVYDDNGEISKRLQILAQKGRAAGIHLILATQRPSAKIIDEAIKNNLGVRISFKVPAMVNSRVILDEGGAEKLLSNGDFLIKGTGYNETMRGQAYSNK